ncbi:hypothetical protein I8D64_11590 [Brachybacterium sp. MASK1Z-5]|uniref:Rv3660c-like CheY-like N-terminal domain-containing protein n=1 Tax=Brachybacterium halotolerans TaxID=2795215 RepID=A0ABS1BBI9_9MICO|nr:hypothetical protein [Brachybacterium halotolerans]MBK0332042.1 hypothetical protein [Brachybacterium halotolerans]
MTSLLDRPALRTPSRFPAASSPPSAAGPREHAADQRGRGQGSGAVGGASAVVLWHDVAVEEDAAGSLRALVADHAGAAGAVLRDAREPAAPGSSGPAGRAGTGRGADAREALHLCTPAALLADPPRTARSRLLVVTDRPVSEPVWRRALELEAAAVLRLPEDSTRLLSLLGDALRPRQSARIIGVVGGCGGAGASSLAARLAGAAARAGRSSVLIDADPMGGGLDALVEAPELRGACWEDLSGIDAADGEALVAGLPEVDDVHLLVAREDPAPSGMQLDHVLAALDSLTAQVVVDLAPDLVGPAIAHLDRLYVVLPATDHALRATARRLAAWHLPPGGAEAVLRGRGPVSSADVREALHLGVAGRFADSSRGTVPLLDVRRRGADGLARRLASSWEDAR